MASVVVVLFRPPDFTTNARHHKCLIFSKCSVSPTDFAEEANFDLQSGTEGHQRALLALS